MALVLPEDEDIVQIDEEALDAPEDVSQELLPGPWPRGQPERLSVVLVGSAPWG